MFRTALRNVLSHKARLLMTVLAVLLGVAFVSGTLVFTDTLSHAFRNESAKNYSDVAVAVTSYSDSDNPKEAPGVSTKTLDRIRGLDGVASATGRVSGFAGVADHQGKLIGDGWSNKGGNFSPAPGARTASTRSPTARARCGTARSRWTGTPRTRAATTSVTPCGSRRTGRCASTPSPGSSPPTTARSAPAAAWSSSTPRSRRSSI